MLNACKVKLNIKTGVYSISGDRGVRLKGVKGLWAEVLENGSVKYSVALESGGRNILRDKFGNILLEIDSKKTEAENHISTICGQETSVESQSPCIRTSLLPEIELNNELPDSEHLALFLCNGAF